MSVEPLWLIPPWAFCLLSLHLGSEGTCFQAYAWDYGLTADRHALVECRAGGVLSFPADTYPELWERLERRKANMCTHVFPSIYRLPEGCDFYAQYLEIPAEAAEGGDDVRVAP